MTNELKLFVWEGVLTDWSSGFVCAYAENLEEAIKKIKEKDKTGASAMDTSVVREVEKPEAFVIWGGS